jgi:hypothetical protein
MFNYYFDSDRDGHADTVRLFEAIGAGDYEGFTSEYVIMELKKAKEPKQSEMVNLIGKYGIKMLNHSDETVRLANIYIDKYIIPAKFETDARHIAIASVNGLDCVISYNFKHINKMKAKVMTARINRAEGYNSIIICTSKEVLADELYD